MENKVKWTKDQERAIYTRYRNVLVSAAAGSGKTAVLVERIINIITDEDNPVDIDKLLIVTFTNAAAAEMRERIGEAINKKIKENPNNRRLQRQLTLLNKANISTLHSFCLYLIKNNFHQIDVEPNFRVGDTTEITLLKIEAMDEVMEQLYGEGRVEFYDLIESYCDNKSDDSLVQMVFKLYNFSMSMPNPHQWLLEKCETFNVEEGFSIENLPFKEELIKELKENLEECLKLNERALEILEDEVFLEKYLKLFSEEGEYIRESISLLGDMKKATEYMESVEFIRIPTIKTLDDNEKNIKDRVRGYRDEYKKLYQNISKGFIKATSSENIEYMQKVYPLMKELSNIVIVFHEKFKKKKKEKGIIDFNDQEHLALEILTAIDEDGKAMPSNVALALRDKFEEILVDEYQDSNSVQESIINLICREETTKRNVFMVGDLKQSIYRFRMAKPELFKAKKDSYPKNQGEDNVLITLHKNFRSREEVIDGINYIFKCVMSEEVGELSYDEGEELKVGASFKEFNGLGYVGGDVDINLIELKSETTENEEDAEQESNDNTYEGKEESSEDNQEEIEEEELNAMQVEARFVGKRIQELIWENGENTLKVYDKNIDDYRKISYRDIVILLRSANKVSPIFSEEFKNLNIPLFTEGGSGYFDSLEVKTVISVLKIIDNPLQDIPLIAVLRGPIGGFTTEELADIRLVNKNTNFYEALKKCTLEEVTNMKHETKEKINKFLVTLNKWREVSAYTPINELIWNIVTQTGYYGYVGALPGGAQRQANLKVLFQRAKDFERTSYKGLYSFINFINNVKQSSDDFGSAKIIGESEDVVRIMSIHKSKGLEFPVVFLCGIGKKFNEGDLKGKVLFHHELGYGPNYVDLDNRISTSTLQRDFISKKIYSENRSEEMRLLYVALTRAKEKLILVGSGNNLVKKLESLSAATWDHSGKINYSFIRKQKSYMDWVCSAVLRHRDGKPMRKDIKDLDINNIYEDNSRFKVAFHNKADFYLEERNIEESNIEEKLKELERTQDYEEKAKYINNILSYKYKYEEATKLSPVVSVTELKNLNNMDLKGKTLEDLKVTKAFKGLLRTPIFLQEKKGLTPAEIGTAYHSVMQRIDLNKISNEEEIRVQIQQLVERELLTEEEQRVVEVSKIFNFFKSNIGRRMINAFHNDKLKREVPFRIELDSTHIYPILDEDIYMDEKILLRGVIDCYFQDEQGSVILDYKTDYTPEYKIDKIKDQYETQLKYYALAIERIFGIKGAEKYLYLFWLEREVKVGN